MLTPQELVQSAIEARRQAYAPYSHYAVGAALLCADGMVILGCNVENASYGATICAERVALTAAVAQGKRAYIALAVATQNAGSPCGICRQVMAELGPQMAIYITDADGRFRTTSVADMLPDWFTGEKLASS